ncbi:MAG: N-carbamoylsarcosine amidohydrolase [Thermoanaerobaculia bacterium]
MSPTGRTDGVSGRTSGAILADYQKKGIGARIGFGRRPAVLVVDFMRGFTDPGSPLGSNLDREVEATVRLLQGARQRRISVLFTVTLYEPGFADGGLFIAKVPSLRILERGSEWVELDPRLERRELETVIEKKYASAFFATPLASTLTSQGVDTLLIAGCTTSGCVRATAVDALQHGWRAIVPRECVGDRAPEPHIANLLDIDSKYGDVVGLNEALEYLGRLND